MNKNNKIAFMFTKVNTFCATKRHKTPQNYIFLATITGLFIFATIFVPQLCHNYATIAPQKVKLFLPQISAPQFCHKMPQNATNFYHQILFVEC